MARTRRGFALWHVVLTLPWIVAVLVARSSIGDNSFLWHVTAGRLQRRSGSVLTEDPFSIITLGESWRTQSWLADVLYAWLDDRLDLGFVPWLRFFGALVLFAVVISTAWRVSRSLAATASMSFLVALLAVPYLNPRPVLFSYVLLASVVLAERERSLRWALMPIFFVWASVHGSWVIGAGYLAVKVLERREYHRIRGEAPWILVATMVTAHGWGVFDYLFAFADGSEALSLISEWGVPDLISVARMPFTICLLVIMFGAASGRLSVRQVGFAVPFILFGLTSNRSVLPAVLMLVPVVSTALAGLMRGRFERPLIGVKVIIALVLVLPLVLPVEGGLDTKRFPVEHIEAAGTQRLFHDDVIGGYLIYAEWPETEVLIDDRAELYGGELRRFVDARAGRDGWQEYFEEYGFRTAILPKGSPLVELLRLTGWSEVEVASDEEGWTLLERGG